MTGMEHAIEKAARVIDSILGADPQVSHEMRGDEPGKIARALAEAGLLAPAPLTEIRAENLFGETHRRWATDWEPVDRAEGDGRADCGCADCHTGLFPIMHVCADCGSKRCPRAIHHANPCNGRADQ